MAEPDSSRASSLEEEGEAEVVPLEDSEDPTQVITVEDVLCEECLAPTEPTDDTIGYRSMSREALQKEARSLRHMASHFPHNPYCWVCIQANMRQRRFAKKGEPEDDGLQRVTKPNQRYSTDIVIVAKAKEDTANRSSDGDVCIQPVRDVFSGAALATALRERGFDRIYNNLKFFAGPAVRNPNLLCKSDCAKEIINAVEALGWHSEPSLENTWPHNAIQERWIGTYKSVLRAAQYQCGFLKNAWHLPVRYASVALTLTQKAPILPWEKDAAGNTLAGFKYKELKTCWEVHTGETFTGPIQPFGRLCFYRDINKNHALGANCSPGFFIGWQIESGMRYRGILQVIDYETIRAGRFSIRAIRKPHQKEVHFPLQVVFPMAEARMLQWKTLADEKELTDAPPPPALLFGEAIQGEESAGVDGGSRAIAPALPPRFKITAQRIKDYGGTDDCSACDNLGLQAGQLHTIACRQRFRELLEQDGEIPKYLPATPEQPSGARAPEGSTGGDRLEEVVAEEISEK